MAGIAQVVALCASFWVALAGFWWRRRDGEGAARYVVGLGLGAIAAHLGWLALHADRVGATGRQGLFGLTGFSVIFLPMGLLVAAVGLRGAARARFLAAGFASLLPALVLARVGCLFAGCCHGVATDGPWGVVVGGRSVHPTPVYEIAILLLLTLVVRPLPEHAVPPSVLAGLGAARLALEPLRATAPLGPPLVPIALVASSMIAVGVAWALLRRVRCFERGAALPTGLRPSSVSSQPPP